MGWKAKAGPVYSLVCRHGQAYFLIPAADCPCMWVPRLPKGWPFLSSPVPTLPSPFSFSPQMSCPRLLWKSLALGYCSPPRPSVWLALSLGFHWALLIWVWAGSVSFQGRVWSGWQPFSGTMIRTTTHPWRADSWSPRTPPTTKYSSRCPVWTLQILPHTPVLREHIDTASVFSCTIF